MSSLKSFEQDLEVVKARWYGTRGGGKSYNRPAKRGSDAKPSAERARHNRARNLKEQKRKESYLKRVEHKVETTEQVVAKRASKVGEPDSVEYLARKSEHEQFITIYGRKTVREALRDPEMTFRHIYMDEKVIAVNSNVARNEADPVVLEILDLARERKVKLIAADKMKISYISKNGKQDGGIVADLHTPAGSKLTSVADFISKGDARSRSSSLSTASSTSTASSSTSSSYTILALDQITTPANMGMIIRSAVAAQSFDAILVGDGSVPVTNPLVIKASASTALLAAKSSPFASSSSNPSSTSFIAAKEGMFRALTALRNDGADIVLLAAESRGTRQSHSVPASISLWDFQPSNKCVFVIGGESSGHDPAVEQAANIRVHIPMAQGVESLNVAVTASLLAFAPHLRGKKTL